MKRLSYKEVKEAIECVTGYELLSKEYINSKTKLEIKCSNNHIFEMNYDNFKHGKRCLECHGVIRWNYDKVKHYIEVESKSNYKLMTTNYKNMHTKMTIECDEGHIYDVSFSNFYHTKSRCPRCMGCGKLTYADVKRIIEIESQSGYKLISKEYKNNDEKIDTLCPDGHIYNASLRSFQQGNRCKSCAEIDKIKRQTHTYEYVKEKIESTGYKLLSDTYIDSETHLIVKCDQGHVYSVKFNNFNQGKRCNECYRIKNIGENHPSWNPNITDEERKIKRLFKGYSDWRESVYERDNYTCQCCSDSKGGNLNAHHKDGYNWRKDRRIDVSNGVTLCDKCHVDFHLIYGFGDNTEQQYNEWIKFKNENKLNKNNIPILTPTS